MENSNEGQTLGLKVTKESISQDMEKSGKTRGPTTENRKMTLHVKLHL